MSATGVGDLVNVSWSDIPSEEPRAGVSRRAVGNDDVMVVRNECRPGMDLLPHSHAFPQIALILRGHGVFHVGGERHPVGPESVVVIPAGVEHHLEPTGDEAVVNIDVFAPARDDYRHLLAWLG